MATNTSGEPVNPHFEMLRLLLVTANEMHRLRERGERPQGADWHAVTRSIQRIQREAGYWQEFLTPPRRSRVGRGPEPDVPEW